MQVRALFDKERRNALRGAVAKGDLGNVLRKQAGPVSKPGALFIIPSQRGVPMIEAIMKADEAGLVMATNRKIDTALDDNELMLLIWKAFPCWTGTMTGYVEAGRSFREAGKWSNSLNSHVIDYIDTPTGTRYFFPVPEQFLDKRDSILVVNHPNFRLEKNGADMVVRAATIHLVERFPQISGSYDAADPQFGIPTGDASTRVPDNAAGARYLDRTIRWVGLIARDSETNAVASSMQRPVYLGDNASRLFGLVVEKPGRDDSHAL